MKILFIALIIFGISIQAQNIMSNQILLTFSEPMDSAGFKDVSNWTVTTSDGIDIPIIGGGIDPTKQPLQGFTEFIIIIAEGVLQFEVLYEVRVVNVTDLAGNVIEEANFVWFVTSFRKTSIPTPNVWIGTPPVREFTLINSGGIEDYIDSRQRTWEIDYGSSNGTAVDRGFIAIANTNDPVIYRTERYGADMFYQIPVPNALYDVKLHFCETFGGITQSGQRIFNVSVEGNQLNGLDIFSESGGRYMALIKTFNNISVQDGIIDIIFGRVIQMPLINGIEILELNN